MDEKSTTPITDADVEEILARAEPGIVELVAAYESAESAYLRASSAPVAAGSFYAIDTTRR